MNGSDASLIHKHIATKYDRDYADIYAQTRALALAQLQQYLPQHFNSVCDFCLGTGNSFLWLHEHFDIDHYIGNDVSEAMLTVAKEKLHFPIEIVCDDVANIEQHVPPQSQDLILVHFLFAYSNKEKILQTAYRLLKPGGYISIISATEKNLSELRTHTFSFAKKWFRFDSQMEDSYCPVSQQKQLQQLEDHGYKIMAHDLFDKEIVFKNAHDLWQWGYDSGWVVSWFDRYHWLKVRFAKTVLAILEKTTSIFPCSAKSDISVVLVSKNKR